MSLGEQGGRKSEKPLFLDCILVVKKSSRIDFQADFRFSLERCG